MFVIKRGEACFHGNHILSFLLPQIPSIESFKQYKTKDNMVQIEALSHLPFLWLRIFHFIQAMQKKESDFQSLGICHRIFNFFMNSLIGTGLKRVSLGHPLPKGSTNEGPLDENARNGVQEPLISHAKPNGEERANSNSKLKDDSDSVVHIHFKQTEEELDHWTPVDKLGSSVYVAGKDDEAMEKRNVIIDSSGKKEIPLLNGISLDTNKLQVHEKTEVPIQGEGSTGSKIIIPITDNAGQRNEKKNKAGNNFPSPKLAKPVQPDANKPMLTGLGLNINEISDTFIQNTKERLTRNVSLMDPPES